MAAASPPFVARWDLDKTYLRTEFHSLRALVRTAIERPDHKRAVPGAPAVMRALGDAGAFIHILSGSPEQLRRRIEQKLRLDAVRYSSLTLKPNLQNLLRLRLRALRGQLGYKLPALLRARCELPSQHRPTGELVPEVLLGDDAEADALVYCLYADACAGAVEPAEIAAVLRASGAYEDAVADVERLLRYVERGPVVRRVLIHLDRQSAPAAFQRFGARVVPFFNYAQAAFVLLDEGCIGPDGLWSVVRELVIHHHFDADALVRSYEELGARGAVSGAGLERLLAARGPASRRAVGPDAELDALRERLSCLPAERQCPTPSFAPSIDYLGLVGRLGRGGR